MMLYLQMVGQTKPLAHLLYGCAQSARFALIALTQSTYFAVFKGHALNQDAFGLLPLHLQRRASVCQCVRDT